MKRLLILIMLSVAGTAFAIQPPPVPRLTLTAPERITAGEAWALMVEAEGATAGEKVSVLLLNGLRRLNAELTLGTGGIARWSFDEGELTAAGQSLIIARYGEEEVRQTLSVAPDAVQAVEVLTTANSVPAGAAGRSTIIALAGDTWGNPVRDMPGAALRVRYPAGRESIRPMSAAGLLYWAEVISFGGAGRTQITASIGGQRSGLELQQTPGDAAYIALSMQPECIPNTDGRDLLALEAVVRDDDGAPVTDGTLVSFMWEGGRGGGITVNGVAALRLPAPSAAGVYHYRASAGGATSNRAVLRVGRC